MRNISPAGNDESLREALDHLVCAIELLDQAGAPAHIAAHVDLAAHEVKNLGEPGPWQASVTDIETNADPQ